MDHADRHAHRLAGFGDRAAAVQCKADAAGHDCESFPYCRMIMRRRDSRPGPEVQIDDEPVSGGVCRAYSDYRSLAGHRIFEHVAPPGHLASFIRSIDKSITTRRINAAYEECRPGIMSER